MAVSAMLTLYIMFTALSYLAGNVQLTHTELIVRIVKIAIVSALLSTEYSWSFFNDYLFVYFIGGVEQILQMIVEAGATGPGSPGILAMMIAPQTLSKLFSLLFVDALGWIYIILFIAALYFVIMIFFEAAVIYLSALIAIGLIITMAPVFICFLLFGITRSLFENWLRQLISYAIQPIILFTGLIFISMILRQEIYGTLGFRVCKHSFPKMTTGSEPLFGSKTQETLGFNLGDSIFYWWFPQPMKGENFTRTTTPIPVPIDHFTSDDNVVGTVSDTGFCEAYACIGERYVDLPFLDPDTTRGRRRIDQFHNGKFVQLDGMLLILVAIYLLHKFNGLAIKVARFISGTSGNLTSLGNVGDAVKAQTFAKLNKQLARMPMRAVDTAIGRGDRDRGRKLRQDLMQTIKSSPSVFVDKFRINLLKKEALTSRANKAVLAEVQKNTGLKQGDIKKGAVKEYRKTLAAKLKAIDPTLTDKQARKLAAKMSRKKPSELGNELARAKYGKEYNKLSAAEKKAIDALNDKDLRAKARDANMAKKFQDAYVDAYAKMSDRGIGTIGKRSKTIRSLEEIKHDVDERRKLKEAKQRQIGEELYSEYEGLKSGAYSALTGGKKDAISRKFGGGVWHEINTDPSAGNYRMQTHAEMIADERKNIERQEITRDIESLSRKHGENVTSPEFLLQAQKNHDPNLATFQSLERREINSQVQIALSSGEDPALKGETYMSKYAKDSEMEHMIDRAYEVEKELIAQDEFIQRQEEYQVNFDLALEDVQSVYDRMSAAYERDDITADELPGLLEDYNSRHSDMNADQVKERSKELQQSIAEVASSQEVLQQIDHRKAEIAQEVEKHVSGINAHRTNAGMEEYHPEKPDLGIRKLRKIDDLIRK
jgi:type IV secretion system protein VirB6